MDQNTLKVILFFNSSLASSKNKQYLIVVLKHVKNFFQNILLKTA